MLDLKFSVRFFKKDYTLKQDEYIVQCIDSNCNFDESKIKAVKISICDVDGKLNEVSSQSIKEMLSKITIQENELQSLEKSFLKAISTGLSDSKSCFNFTIQKNGNQFNFGEIEKVLVIYSKNVNGSPFSKVFSSDLSAVIACAKKAWFDNSDMDDFSYPTQLNIDMLFDTEDNKNLYYVEFDVNGEWFDATTWESGEEVKNYFSETPIDLEENISNLKSNINMSFSEEWSSVYYDGEVLSKDDYDNLMVNK